MSTPTVLVMDEVTFSYRPGDTPVLENWSAAFEAGRMAALTGPSGSGKSTLLYLLGLMVRPKAGQIQLKGRRVDHLPDGTRAGLRASEFGFVFQDAVLDPSRTVLDNIVETALYRGQPRGHAVRRAHDLLERFGVELRASHRPGEISGGQAQRIALCRALLGNPPIVLADEPTGNLDHASTQVVLDSLRQHAGSGAAVIIATHEDAVMSACDERLRIG